MSRMSGVNLDRAVAEIRARNLDLQPRRNEFMPHEPNPGAQATFLSPIVNGFRDVYYGGAAGGGKSNALLLAALQFVDLPGYDAVIVRKTYPMLDQPGGLIQRSLEWLLPTTAKWNAGKHRWTFPSGSTLTFRHLATQQALADYQGAEYDFIGVDEVTDFAEDQFRFLFSRLRRVIGPQAVPLRFRSASNPIGPGRAWVRARYVDTGHRPGRLYIPARLEDNPMLDAESYEQSLRELGSVMYRQLRFGDWEVQPEGVLFKRTWFPIVEEAEVPKVRKVRRWDLAATETPKGRAARSQGDPDWTAGLLLGRGDDGRYFVLDVARFREDPGSVERRIAAIASQDGRGVPVRMEQEGGASGKSLIQHYRRRVLDGYDFRGVASTGNKEVRATPVAARAEQGEIVLVRGPWVADFLDELAEFPEGLHDDQVDALSGAYADLAGKTARARAVQPTGFTAGSIWRGQ
jgi:predicted phage terminase large subunit-like protein